jgi:two-component SAPR family response regulator
MRIKPNNKALFISGYTYDVITRKGIIKEGLNFIAKPVQPEELLRKVHDVLRIKADAA